MSRHKLKFEDYEELALDIRTAEQLVNWVTTLHGGVKFRNKLNKVSNVLMSVKSELEEEMFSDFPDKANTNVFYGFGNYSLDVRKHKEYIYSSFKNHEEKGEQ